MSSIGKDGPIGVKPEPPVEKSKEWGEWAREAFEALQARIKGDDKNRLSKTLIAEKKLSAAYRAIRRGVLTREFLAGPFWKEFFEPLLIGKESIKPWAPGDPTEHMAIVSLHLWSSGKAAIAREILTTLGEWIRAGEEAKRIVADEAEKKKQIRDLGRA